MSSNILTHIYIQGLDLLPVRGNPLHLLSNNFNLVVVLQKKLSIPATVARVVKYVPELQQQVEGLIQKKEELLSRISRQGEQFHQGNQRVQNPARSSSSSVSANWLNDREVMIQISTYKVDRSPLDEILLNLEKDGFLLQNASSFESSGGRVFYNLHLQVRTFIFCLRFLQS